MDEGLRGAGLSEYAKKYSANGVERRKDTAQDRTLESVAMSAPQDYSEEIETLISSVKRLKDTNEECHELAREIDRLATEIRENTPKA